MRVEVPEREAGEERHGAEPPLERDVERKAEDMSQVMGMFSQLVSSYVHVFEWRFLLHWHSSQRRRRAHPY